jgi:hypothetical protein
MLLKLIHRYTCKEILNISNLHNNKVVLGRHFLDIGYMQENDYNFRFVSGYIGNHYCRERLWTICRLSTINIQEIKPHMFIPPPAVINTFKSRKLQSTIKNISFHACVNTMNCRFALCVLNMMPKSFSAIVIPNVTGYKSKIVIVFLQ